MEVVVAMRTALTSAAPAISRAATATAVWAAWAASVADVAVAVVAVISGGTATDEERRGWGQGHQHGDAEFQKTIEPHTQCCEKS